MPVTDPIADMLTRIRNAVAVRRESVFMPTSKLKLAIAHLLKREGFINDYELVKNDGVQMDLRIHLRYGDGKTPYLRGLRRASRPGLRRYVSLRIMPRNYRGLGVSVISTSRGLMTGYQARAQGVGGELLCYVW